MSANCSFIKIFFNKISECQCQAGWSGKYCDQRTCPEDMYGPECQCKCSCNATNSYS